MSPELFAQKMQQAKLLQQQDKLPQALDLYEEIYALEEYKQNLGLIYALLYCLNKAGNYARALEIGLPACALPQAWDSIRQNTAWCVYFHYFKTRAKLSAETALDWLQKIAELFPLRQGLHPLPLSVFAYVTSHPELAPTCAIQFLQLLNPTLLDSTPAPGKQSPLPSQREKYVSLLSKALYAAGQYQECRALCEDLIGSKLPLAQNSELWLQRRIAMCQSSLGEARAALDIYSSILLRKQDWFLLHEAAELCYRLELYDDALSHAVKAALAFGDIENKIHLWELLKQLMSRLKDFDHAIALLRLIASIRKHKQWSLGSELLGELSAYNIPLQTLPHFNVLFGELKPWLRSLLFKPEAALTGTIANILPHGKAGFVKSGNSSYYFRVSELRFKPDLLRAGLRVSFHTQVGFDPKKQQEAVSAVNIRLAGD